MPTCSSYIDYAIIIVMVIVGCLIMCIVAHNDEVNGVGVSEEIWLEQHTEACKNKDVDNYINIALENT